MIRQLVRNHQTASYFVLALAISWAIWIPAFATLEATEITMATVIPGAFGPLLAGIVVTWVSGESVRGWLRSVIAWRTNARWYLAALVAPLLLGAGVGVVLFVDAGAFDWALLGQQLVFYPLALLFTALLGGGQEEFGWRGFALPRLQERYDALVASLAVGVVWALWHLPLFAFESGIYSDLPYGQYVLAVIAFSVLHTWIYNGSRGLVPVAILFHGGINVAVDLSAPAVGGEAALSVSPVGVIAVVGWIAAIAIVVRYGHESLADDPAVTRSESGASAGTEGTVIGARSTDV